MTDLELPCRNTVNKSLLLLFFIIILRAFAPKKRKIHAEGITALYHLFPLHFRACWFSHLTGGVNIKQPAIYSRLIGGMRTRIAKHHGRCSKSDHLSQDGVDRRCRRKRLWRRIFVKYAVEIRDLPLFSSRDVWKTKAIELSEKNSVIPLISVFCSKSPACSWWIEGLL